MEHKNTKRQIITRTGRGTGAVPSLTDLHQHREVGGQPVGLQPPADWEPGAEQQVERPERSRERQRLQQHRHLQTEQERVERAGDVKLVKTSI